MPDSHTVGQVIRARRLALGLTQEQVTDAVARQGFDRFRQSYFSQIERDQVETPGKALLSAIANALELPALTLLEAAGHVRLVEGGGDVTSIPFVGAVPADALRFSLLERMGPDVQIPAALARGHRAPLFAVRASGDCLTERGIVDGTTVVLESVGEVEQLRHGAIVLVRVGDALTLKIWQPVPGGVELVTGAGEVVARLSATDDAGVIGRAFYWFSGDE